MSDKVKIASLELENVKRVSFVEFDVTENGLTLIGGPNAAGKTTILDSIAFALGGAKYKPSKLQHEGSFTDAHIKIELSNGLIIERKGKNASLKITDPTGNKSGQALLDSFVEELALDLPKFLKMTDAQKAEQLLRIIGVEEELKKIDLKESVLVQERYDLKRDYESKLAHAKSLDSYPEAPAELLSAADLIEKSQKILLKNEENQRKRQQLQTLEEQKENEVKRIYELKQSLKDAEAKLEETKKDLAIAKTSAKDLQDESTQELQEQISSIDDVNAKVRSNLDKEHAEDQARQYKDMVETKEAEIKLIRAERKALLDEADLPLEGLSIDKDNNGNPLITYNGNAWDCMSGMERIKVAAAIVQQLKPECGFILLDGLEAFDIENLKELKQWLIQEDLQAIGTRVGIDEECTIIIENGQKVKEQPKQPQKEKTSWV